MATTIKIKEGKTTALILRETTMQSVLSDCFTFLMLASLCSYGVFIGSFVIELIGGVMFMIFVVARSLYTVNGNSPHVTTDEAIEILRKWQEERK